MPSDDFVPVDETTEETPKTRKFPFTRKQVLTVLGATALGLGLGVALGVLGSSDEDEDSDETVYTEDES